MTAKEAERTKVMKIIINESPIGTMDLACTGGSFEYFLLIVSKAASTVPIIHTSIEP